MSFLDSFAQATYTLTALDVTSVGGAALDIANSVFGIVADVLPILVPVIVVFFGIKMVMRRLG